MTLIARWSRRLRYGPPIVIVSGLPRSGTSMAMKMLQGGGLPLLTDGARPSDASNPEGYFEFEPVKQLDKDGDLAWLRSARGKGVKVISWLLTWLPEHYDYRVIFMLRDLDEVMASQNAMLLGRGQPEAIDDPASMRRTYERHLEQVQRFLEHRRCFTTLTVNYADVVVRPSAEATRLAEFLHRPLDVERMAAAVDPRLYRNRSA
jgi:sulfotransferase family protein